MKALMMIQDQEGDHSAVSVKHKGSVTTQRGVHAGVQTKTHTLIQFKSITDVQR